jgi:cell division protein ZapE
MKVNSLHDKFIQYCNDNKLEKNKNQIIILDSLINFYNKKNSFLKIFSKSVEKKSFYLYGDVGSGKTMILNFFYNNTNERKQRFHFNEFMIKFHDFQHAFKNKNKVRSIENFVIDIKNKCNLMYLDEFQVTNIVDAMILGKLFEIMFKENIKIIITSNIKIENLYKDGLQREQFLPFISIIKKFSIEKELIKNEDYRKLRFKNLARFFYPLNEKTNFTVNQLFREITKGKKQTKKIITVKLREFEIQNYFEKIVRFDFNDLCGVTIGSEDYIKIADQCRFLVIDNIPNFSNENMNKQQRFITLIDILYEKKILLMISCASDLENISSSSNLIKPFKRTISRLYELTSPNRQL